MTKRTLASILMGSLHGSLQIMAPYVNNIKLIYRDVCRMNTAWDQEVTKKIEERIIEVLEYFLPWQMERVQFARKTAFSEAKAIKFKIYFDGSKQGIGVSVVVKNTLPNDKVINRLLCNKSRLVGEDVNTAPRSELCACLIMYRY